MANALSRCCALVAPLVVASWMSTSEASDPAINVGAIEVVAAPDPAHLGVYPYVAGSLAVPLGPGILIPSVGLEYSPEHGRWGFAATLGFDYPLTRRIGVDVLVSLIHDQDGMQWSDAALLAGGGLGMSFGFGKLVVSPSVSLLHGLNVPGWSVVPGVNFSRGL